MQTQLLRLTLLAGALGLMAQAAPGAERRIDFSIMTEGPLPAGFRSTLSGQGKPGDWKIVTDDVPSLMPSFDPKAPEMAKQAVLAQTSQDRTDSHYPLLLWTNEVFGDFTLTTRFKLVSGETEQMAGIAFRIQDEKNYYYVRASGLGGTFYFFKFVNGELIGPVGSKLAISNGVWHEMSIACKGSQVTCSLDGKVVIPEMLQDNFPKGKIGFWTKSDSVSHFGDTRIVYTPLEDPALAVVRATFHKYSRLLGLKIFVLNAGAKTTRLVASTDASELGRAGGKPEFEVITKGQIYYGKEKASVLVTMPLRDRNGDTIAAVKFVMRTFPGQTEENAIARATPIVHYMQEQVRSMKDLVD